MTTSTVLIVFAITLFSYFLPTIIAQARGHHNWVAIAALNLLAGWTGLGWIVALVWSLLRQPEYEYED